LAVVQPSQAQAQEAHVVVVEAVAAEDLLNLTVATYTRPGMVQSAGLFVNGSLISNETGGVWLTYGTPGTLHFRVRGHPASADLRLTYAYPYGSNTTVVLQTIPLTLSQRPDVRPVDAWADEAGNATVALRNFGAATARDLLVGLQDAAGSSVGLPYVRELAALAPGATVEVAFVLLDASEDPLVVVESGGARRAYAVVLRGEDAAGAAPLRGVELATELPSLEASPGGSAQYALTLTNRGPERHVALGTSGLPEAYATAFTIQGSRVQTVQLAAGATRTVQLTVAVPSGGDAGAGGGGPRSFEAWVATAGGASSAPLASVPLTLTVAGAERLELSGRNWFASTAAGAPLEAVLTLKNSGTAAAFDIALAAEAPSGWEVSFEPGSVARLGPGEAVEVTLRATSPATTAEGRYVLDVTAQSPASAARERSFSVEVAPPDAPSPLPWLLGAGAALGGALALVVFLRRR
jgi:hypothetical protein